jgi:hypothetical protein
MQFSEREQTGEEQSIKKHSLTTSVQPRRGVFGAERGRDRSPQARAPLRRLRVAAKRRNAFQTHSRRHNSLAAGGDIVRGVPRVDD